MCYPNADRLAAPYDARILACPTKALGELTVFRVDHPSHLGAGVQTSLVDMLMPVAASAFHQAPDRDFREDVASHILNPKGLLVVLNDDGMPIAFRMWDFITLDFVGGTDILYLAGMCVHKDYQGRGIGELLLELVLRDDVLRTMKGDMFVPLPLAPYVALRTQNPVMKFCFDRAIGIESYPRLEDGSVPSDVAMVGTKVASYLKDYSFNPINMISRGLYGHSLYGVPPVPPNHKYAEIFSQLDMALGDSMICVWRRSDTKTIH